MRKLLIIGLFALASCKKETASNNQQPATFARITSAQKVLYPNNFIGRKLNVSVTKPSNCNKLYLYKENNQLYSQWDINKDTSFVVIDHDSKLGTYYYTFKWVGINTSFWEAPIKTFIQ